MIIDAFTFFNELDLLEVRLNEMSPYVDKFLIVESRQTFQGNDKPLYFFENLDRFEKFRGRIIHVVAELPEGKTYEHGWERENASRDAIAKGLEGIPDDAILLLSDLDEIPNLIGWDSNREVPACWSHQLYYYYVDLEVCRIKGTVAIPVKTFFNHPEIMGLGSKLREWRHYNPKFVLEGTRGGWHFSYLGGPAAIEAKIKAFAHAELTPHANPASIRQALSEDWKNGIDLFDREIYQFKHVKDGDLPRYMVDNREKFSYFWMPDKLPLEYGLKELTPVEVMKQLVVEEGLDIDLASFDAAEKIEVAQALESLEVHLDKIEGALAEIAADETIAAIQAEESADLLPTPNVVDSGPIVMSMAKDTISDMIQEGYFKCETSEESDARGPEEPGSSGSETTEPLSLSQPDDLLLTAYMNPAVEAIGKIVEEDLLNKYEAFQSPTK